MATRKTAKATETVEQVAVAAEETTEQATTAAEETTETVEDTTEAEDTEMKLYKVKVKITYRDKNTGEIMKAGKVIMVDQNRYKELTEKKKFVEKM